jgi:hypothetical protein
MAAPISSLRVPADGSPVVFILRGVSGAGKSSLTRQLTAGLAPAAFRVCSADKYFEGPGGYAFDAASLPQAHAWCRALFDAALRGRVRVIILDNTNTQRRDYAPYVAAVHALNADIRSGVAPAGMPYALRVLQVECRDAATLFLFSGESSVRPACTLCARARVRAPLALTVAPSAAPRCRPCPRPAPRPRAPRLAPAREQGASCMASRGR